MYFVVKVTSGQERIAANMLQNKWSKMAIPIYAILVVEGRKDEEDRDDKQIPGIF